MVTTEKVLELVEPDIQEYLISSDVIDWHDCKIQQKSKEICAGLTNTVSKVKALFEWVRDNILHSKDVQLGIVTYPEEREDLDEFMDLLVWKASDVLEAGHGICYAQSHLLAALLRVQGIPAGLIYQVLCKDSSRSGKVVHGLNAVYLDTLQKWLLLDARGHDTKFGLDGKSLAFEMDEGLGELLYPKIYALPHPKVFDVLTRFTSRRVMWPYLPHNL